MQSLSKEKITFYLQDNLSVLVDTSSEIAQESAYELIKFSELVKIPKGFHTYQISPLSIWNACASGIPIDNIVICLEKYSLKPLPEKFKEQLFLYYNRYNKIFLRQHSSTHIRLETLLSELVPLFQSHEFQFEYDLMPESNNSFLLPIKFRGAFKQKMIHIGFPVEDLVGYAQGDTFKVNLREQTKLGSALNIRHYQREAVDRFFDSPLSKNGSGVIVLPCGAGKTIVGLCALSHISEYALILTNSMTSAYQWRRELLDKTTVQEHEVEIYSSENKKTAPLTISTYQMLTYRPSKESDFLHFDLFNAKSWGLIIYDEVHLLPAPVFRITAELQSKKRLGLTATLIREDGHEGDVFALIGPKKYDLPWKELEKEQFIACFTKLRT
jgi:DNA excision repair protein ERCC-3